MKITCPKCDTSYNIGANSVGPEGRSVRCSRCSEEWYIDSEGHSIAPPPDEPELADAEEDEQAASRASDDEWSAAFAEETEDKPAAPRNDDDWKDEIGLNDNDGDDFAAPKPRAGNAAVIESEPSGFGDPDDEEVDEETLRERARRRAAYESKFLMTPEVRAVIGLVLFLTSIVMMMGFILMREPIVRAAPNMAGLYELVGLEVNLRGLEFHDLRTYQEYENGGVVLIVEGRIENTREQSTHVPAVKLALRTSDAQEIYTWKIEPRVRRLPAGQNLRFSTRVASPPDVAADVFVSFVDRNVQTKL